MTGLTPELLLQAYSVGVFPMAESRHASFLYWIDPERRGILPLDGVHIPHKLRRTLRRGGFAVTCDTAFDQVIEMCAEPTMKRPDTWINDEILHLYKRLFELGHAHSVECWQGSKLVGGLYGVSIRAAFFGESMFSRATDASKVALIHLVARLRKGEYELLDSQFITDHLRQFGAVEVARTKYQAILHSALGRDATFHSELSDAEFSAFLQSSTQTT
ncbi:MAG: leucyl/phenylalanyl-tRNA--protein transferase [Alphaproteobacteria bacterium]|nr:leucyl/phenylalanyl-tRNA--protein transferase [Alphaproteobacteria bacterium]